MPPRVMPARGLADLRTLTGRADRRSLSYKEYLRISFLELERARHAQEIEQTRRRLEFMLERCREIDAEKAALLGGAMPAPAVMRQHRPTTAGGADHRPADRAFHFAY